MLCYTLLNVVSMMKSEVYIGETASNGYTYGLQHTDALKKQHKDSVLHAHNCKKHADAAILPTYTMTVTDVYVGDATKRQVAEVRH